MGPVKSTQVVTAMMVLHNIAIKNRDLFERLPEGITLQDGHSDGDNTNEAGKNTRAYYVQNYFT